MCILIHKPKNVEMPGREYLMNCFQSNPDGIGLAWIDKKGNTTIRKGFMKFKHFEEFIKPIGKMLKGCDVILHFRWATHGSVSPGNCHPFPIDTSLRNLRSTYYSGRFGLLAHNGVISELDTFTKKHDLSDTMVMAKLISADGIDNEYIQELLVKGGKFVTTDKRGRVTRYGAFIEDMGVFWSNDTYVYSVVDTWTTYKGKKFVAKPIVNKYDVFEEEDDTDIFDDWYSGMILPDDLDDSGKCIHHGMCQRDHECYISGLTVPQLADRVEYTDICPFYQWTKDDVYKDLMMCR